jgi:hypothetical protein
MTDTPSVAVAAPAFEGVAAQSDRLWPHVVSGVSGRVCAELFMSPINLLKVRLQHDVKLKRMPVPAAMLQLARAEGVLSLWRGLPPRLMWATPLSAATFTYYQAAKKVSAGTDSGDGVGRDKKIVLAGPVMLAASVAIRTPFDIVEQRLQLEGATASVPAATPPTGDGPAAQARRAAPQQPSAFWRSLTALNRIWATEGAPGLWRGYSATLLGVGSFVVGYFVVYESVRKLLRYTPLADYETVTHILAGGIGGGTTAAAATPFDTIKVRMQTRIYATPEVPNPSMLFVARATIREGGWCAALLAIASACVGHRCWANAMHRCAQLGVVPGAEPTAVSTRVPSLPRCLTSALRRPCLLCSPVGGGAGVY